jgi:hypothetical protein
MKNQFGLSAAILIVSIACLSCSNEEELNTKSFNEKKTELKILPIIEGQYGTTSRAVKSSFASGDVIGWYLANSGTTYLGTSYMNKTLTYTTAWAMETTPKLTGEKGTLYAYYPWSSTYTTNFNSIAVETASQTDYMWGSVSGFTSANPSKTLTMKHALAQIAVKIVKGSYAYTGSVTAVKVKGANLGTTGTLNATNGDITVSAGTGTDITLGGGTQTIDTTGKTWTSIFVQVGTNATPSVTITIDGINYSTLLPSFMPEAGKRYVYTVTVNSGTMVVNSAVDITPWQEVAAGNGTIL